MMGLVQKTLIGTAALALVGCESPPEYSPVAKRLAMEDALGTIAPMILVSEHVGQICDNYAYDKKLADADIVGAGRRLFREGYTQTEVDAGTQEVLAVSKVKVGKEVAAGQYGPADQYCPRLENADVQQLLLGLRYLKKVS